MVNAQERSQFSDMSVDLLFIEIFSDAAPLGYGSRSNCAVHLLLMELIICKGANISAPLTTVYLGGPCLDSGSRPLWICDL